MATQVLPRRLALRAQHTAGVADGAWWPQGHRLDDQLTELFALWPPAAGRISRVLYSPPDWEDHPRSVQVVGRTVKTGCFPEDDTHQLTLTMAGGQRLAIAVIPAETPPPVAAGLLAEISPSAAISDAGSIPEWENEGGHP